MHRISYLKRRLLIIYISNSVKMHTLSFQAVDSFVSRIINYVDQYADQAVYMVSIAIAQVVERPLRVR